MKKLFILMLFLNTSLYSQSNWFIQNSNTREKLNSVDFVNENTGYAVGNIGVILKTTNAGVNWQINSIGLTNYLYSVDFVNINTGYAVGGNGAIIKTTNGGTNWFGQNSGTIEILFDIYFYDINTGYVVGNVGKLLKTTNGGTNWVNQVSGVNGIFHVFFITSEIGYVSSQNGVLKTINGGNNWISSGFIGGGDIHFLNLSTGFLTTSSAILKTTNGGINWLYSLINSENFTSVFPINTNIVFATGISGLIYKTTNGGSNWITQNSGTSNSLRSIFFLNSNTGYIVGDSGLILKTTNGGDPIGIFQINTEVSDKYSLSQNYPNPFNPSTDIEFEIPKSSYIKMTIFDISGKEIEVLYNGYLNQGKYSVGWNAVKYSSGIYFYKLETEDYSQSKKMVLAK